MIRVPPGKGLQSRCFCGPKVWSLASSNMASWQILGGFNGKITELNGGSSIAMFDYKRVDSLRRIMNSEQIHFAGS